MIAAITCYIVIRQLLVFKLFFISYNKPVGSMLPKMHWTHRIFLWSKRSCFNFDVMQVFIVQLLPDRHIFQLFGKKLYGTFKPWHPSKFPLTLQPNQKNKKPKIFSRTVIS